VAEAIGLNLGFGCNAQASDRNVADSRSRRWIVDLLLIGDLAAMFVLCERIRY
jgi:hypothetical protein